ncbi:MAG: carboxypeptidase-like regulatory domain-containing protein [Syntrophaceae bacterium]
MKKTAITGFSVIILIILLGGTVLSEDSLTISGQVQSLDVGDPPIIGATVQAWNQGNWISSDVLSGDAGAFTLSGLGAGPGYQIFAWLDNTFIDLATTFIVILADYNGLMLELIPKTMWDEKLGQYDPTSGYLYGTVWGGEDSPVEGAAVLVYDANDEFLPNENFTIRYFDQGLNLDPALDATSANGMFLITLPNAALDETNTDPGTANYPHPHYKDLKITAQKDGWTFLPLNVTGPARVFPFNDSARSGIVTVAEVSGSEIPIFPEEDNNDQDDDGDGGGGGGGCFISSAGW